MKKVLIILAAIIVSFGIGIGVPTLLSDSMQGIEVDQSQLFAEVQLQFVEDLQVARIEKQQDKKAQQASVTETVGEDSIAKTTGTSTELTNKEINPEANATAVTEVVAPPLDEEQNFFVVKDTWVQDQINENRDQISDDDLYTGAAIYNSLDTNYLFGLAADGLTEAEKVEVQDYLAANLSPDEISIAMDLYNKYVYLLN